MGNVCCLVPYGIGSKGAKPLDPKNQFFLITIKLEGNALTHKMFKASKM